MITIKFESAKPPRFIIPALLRHPTIPKSLAQVNPRTIAGQEWWDEHRFKAQRRNNGCCWACSVHRTKAPVLERLEGHEYYYYDTDTCTAYLQGIASLCRYCHAFIHIGMTYRHRSSRAKYIKDVLYHGFKILKDAGISPLFDTRHTARVLLAPYEKDVSDLWISGSSETLFEETEMLKCSSWKLYWEGKKYWRAGYGWPLHEEELSEEEIDECQEIRLMVHQNFMSLISSNLVNAD